jgi:hypothetical protein
MQLMGSWGKGYASLDGNVNFGKLQGMTTPLGTYNQ